MANIFQTLARTLSERILEHLTVQRAVPANPESPHTFFDKLHAYFMSKGLLELTYGDLRQRLWNCDETGICTFVAARKVIVKKGTRVVSEVGCGSGREHITTLFSGFVIGERLPLYVVYKAETIDGNWTTGGSPNTLYSVSSSGWMETPHFQEWFEKLFLPAVKTLTKNGSRHFVS